MELVCSNCNRIFNSDAQSPEGHTKCPFCAEIQKCELGSTQSANIDIGDCKEILNEHYINPENLNNSNLNKTEAENTNKSESELLKRKTGKLRDLTESGRLRKTNKSSIREHKENISAPIVGMSKITKPEIIEEIANLNNGYNKRPIYRPAKFQNWTWLSRKTHKINFHVLITGLIIFISCSVFLLLIEDSRKECKSKFFKLIASAYDKADYEKLSIAKDLAELKWTSNISECADIMNIVSAKISRTQEQPSDSAIEIAGNYSSFEINMMLLNANSTHAKYSRCNTDILLSVAGMMLGTIVIMFAFRAKKTRKNGKTSEDSKT